MEIASSSPVPAIEKNTGKSGESSSHALRSPSIITSQRAKAPQKLTTKLDKFPQKIRLKLRQLRVMKALVKAKQDKKMDEFIMKTYYLAAKQNIADGDKNGPFLKIS